MPNKWNKKGIAIVSLLLFLFVSTMQTCAADNGRVFKSSICPGMGQLGDDQKVKGLSFMAAEIVSITMMIGQFSKSNACARETEMLQTQYKLALNYKDKVKLYSEWGNSFDNSGKAKTSGFIFLGVAGLLWAVNIADAAFFPPAESAEQPENSLNKVISHTDIALSADQNSVGAGLVLKF